MNITIDKIIFRKLAIPFNKAFKHSSATRTETETVWIEVQTQCGITGFGEGCPRSYVTSESISTAHDFFKTYKESIKENIHSLQDLKKWVRSNQKIIDQNPAAWCALELAILDVLAKHKKQSVEKLLGLSEIEGNFQYSAIMGDSSIKSFQKLLLQYYTQGFRDFKIKLSGNLQHDKEKFEQLSSLNDNEIKVRVDANNLWTNAQKAIKYIQALRFPIWAIEEPLTNENYIELSKISQSLACYVILDESFLRSEHFSHLEETPSKWIINLRISKMGGLIRSIEIASHAIKIGIPLIVGAQVGETSLLTRAALTISKHYAKKILKREGGFGTLLLQQDVCNPPLMIDHRGTLSYQTDSTNIEGFSIDVDLESLKSRLKYF